MASNGPTSKEVLLDAIDQTVGLDYLQPIEPTDGPGPATGASLSKPVDNSMCVTQSSLPPVLADLASDPAGLVLGLGSYVPRWVPGSVIKWAAWRHGFESQEDANYAAEQLLLATDAWNQADIGVTFEWVPLAQDATFVLLHGGGSSRDPKLASAFFPNSNDLSFLQVYTAAFNDEWKPNMWKVFLHELGHILGLRHEFAIGDVPSLMNAERDKAVRMDPPDEKSVMNYRGHEAPELQQSDIDSTRKFYKMKVGTMISVLPIVDFPPS